MAKEKQADAPPEPPPPIPHQKSQEAALRRDELLKQLNVMAPEPAAGPEGEKAKPAGKEGKPSHYAVVHNQVGPVWRKGDVGTAEAFGTDAARLELAGAIRPATADEAEVWHAREAGAPARKPLADLPPEEQYAALQERLVWLGEQMTRTTQALEQARLAKAAGQEPPPGIDPKVIAEKDRVNADLSKQVLELKRELQAREAGEPEKGEKGGAHAAAAHPPAHPAAHPAAHPSHPPPKK